MKGEESIDYQACNEEIIRKNLKKNNIQLIGQDRKRRVGVKRIIYGTNCGKKLQDKI